MLSITTQMLSETHTTPTLSITTPMLSITTPMLLESHTTPMFSISTLVFYATRVSCLTTLVYFTTQHWCGKRQHWCFSLPLLQPNGCWRALSKKQAVRRVLLQRHCCAQLLVRRPVPPGSRTERSDHLRTAACSSDVLSCGGVRSAASAASSPINIVGDAGRVEPCIERESGRHAAEALRDIGRANPSLPTQRERGEGVKSGVGTLWNGGSAAGLERFGTEHRFGTPLRGVPTPLRGVPKLLLPREHPVVFPPPLEEPLEEHEQ